MRAKLAILTAVLVMGTAILAFAPAVSALQPVENSGSDSFDEPIGVDCGTFEVWDRWESHWNAKQFFDDDGNLVRVVRHNWGVDTLYNSVTGKSVSGSYNNGSIGDFVNGDVTQNGSVFRIIVPGAGGVFLDVGKYIFDFEEGLVFLAGRHDWFEGDTAALCAALT